MEMKIEIMPACQIAYIRHTGPYGAGHSRAMEDLKAWAKAAGLLDGSAVILGIAQDDPNTTAPENCRYDACIVISGDTQMKGGGICVGTVAGGRYAVFNVAHTAESVQAAWNEIFPALREVELCLDSARPVIERYAAARVNNHRCEICVPVSGN